MTVEAPRLGWAAITSQLTESRLASFRDLHITVEAEYMRRIFNSLSTDPPTGLPATFPRVLDLSGVSWSVGVQLPLPGGRP